MPKISVSTVLFYKGDEHLQPTEKELFLEGIEIRFKGVRFPTEGRTFTYGHDNQANNYIASIATKAGMNSMEVSVSVEIEHWIKHKIILADDPERGIAHTRFLSFSRATREVLDAIDAVCAPVVGKDTIFGKKNVVLFPQALGALKTADEFKHLWVIAYSLETEEVGVIQVATVFDLDSISDVQGDSALAAVEIVM